MTNPLHPYQRTAVAYALDHPACGLFLDMGLGKTLTSIAIMDILRTREPGHHWLILAPARVANHDWPAELDKWHGRHHLTHTLLNGTPGQRLHQLHQPTPDVTIASQELLPWLDDTLPRQWPWDALIIDELSGYRNPRSTRFRILRHHRPHLRRIIGLTGTPVPKSLDNLWAQIHLIDQGASLGRTLTQYRSRWFHPGRRNPATGQIYTWEPNPGAFDQIMDAISPFCLTMLAHDQLPGLPARTLIIHPIRMPDTTRHVYRQLQHDAIADLDPGLIGASNAGVLTGKLSQLTAGILYPDPQDWTLILPRHAPDPTSGHTSLDDTITPLRLEPSPDGLHALIRDTTGRLHPCPTRLVHTSHDGGQTTIRARQTLLDRATRILDHAKLDELDRLIDRLDGTPLLLFHRYRIELDRLTDRYGERIHTLDEPRIRERWDRGDIPILACQPTAAKYGLNLQHGGHVICWTMPTWDLEEWRQANARLDRQGQTRPVQIHVLATTDSVDTRQLDVLAGRSTLADKVAETLKTGA